MDLEINRARLLTLPIGLIHPERPHGGRKAKDRADSTYPCRNSAPISHPIIPAHIKHPAVPRCRRTTTGCRDTGDKSDP